jgi:hypothetical protein
MRKISNYLRLGLKSYGLLDVVSKNKDIGQSIKFYFPMTLKFFFKVCVLFFCSCTSQHCRAQDFGYTPGYVVTNSNDTLRGLVKYANAAPYRRLEIIKFRENEDAKTKEFGPEKNLGFTANGKIFHSYFIPERSFYYFMELAIDGPLRLYELNITSFGASAPGTADMTSYYLLKTGEKRLFTPKGKFKESASKYLEDVPEVGDKIKSGAYTKRDLYEIVTEYNALKEVLKK